AYKSQSYQGECSITARVSYCPISSAFIFQCQWINHSMRYRALNNSRETGVRQRHKTVRHIGTDLNVFHHHRLLMQTVEPYNCRQQVIWIMSRFTPGLACTHLKVGFVDTQCFTSRMVFLTSTLIPLRNENSKSRAVEVNQESRPYYIASAFVHP